MLGRSDGTLNPNGVRFGSSEIYSILESFKEVKDSVCVSQYNTNNEERVVLFLKMENGFQFSQQIVDKIKSEIRLKLSPRHVPAVILEISDIPVSP
jgi:acetoacetyl-CoA synthetase